MEECKQIELRSEKIRHIIGKIPSPLIRLGILGISLIVIGLFVAAGFIRYPENLCAKAEGDNSGKEVLLTIPYSSINEIHVGMKVQIEWEGYPVKQFGYGKGTIISVNKTVLKQDEKNYFLAIVTLEPASRIEVQYQMQGTAFILISNETILSKIIRGKKQQ